MRSRRKMTLEDSTGLLYLCRVRNGAPRSWPYATEFGTDCEDLVPPPFPFLTCKAPPRSSCVHARKAPLGSLPVPLPSQEPYAGSDGPTQLLPDLLLGELGQGLCVGHPVEPDQELLAQPSQRQRFQRLGEGWVGGARKERSWRPYYCSVAGSGYDRRSSERVFTGGHA